MKREQRHGLWQAAAQCLLGGLGGDIVKQIQQCRDEVGAGVIDLAFQSASTEEPQGTLRALELFGKEVLPRIRDL